MFFKPKEDKPKSNWSVSSTHLTNNELQKEYAVGSLFFAANEDDTSATFWHRNRYLVTLKIDRKTLHVLQLQCKRCSGFIPELKDFSFKDVNGMEWERKGQNLVSADGTTYSLISLRFENDSTTEINALCYGVPVFSFNFSDKVFLDEQRDIALRQVHERMSNVSLDGSVTKQQEDSAAIVPQTDVLLTTESVVPFEIEKRIDVITAEVAFGMNIFKDVFAAFSDIFGGRNKSISNTLRDARLVVLQELRLEAKRLGANAVIAIDLDYSEISGNGKSMLFVVASGTAVKMKR